MKKSLLIILTLVFAFTGCTQFINEEVAITGGSIIYNETVEFTTTCSSASSNVNLTTVSFDNLYCENAEDLRIELISPDGTTASLWNKEGSIYTMDGDYAFYAGNYDTDTIIEPKDYLDRVYFGKISSGDFYTSDDCSSFYGVNPNGKWKIKVTNYSTSSSNDISFDSATVHFYY